MTKFDALSGGGSRCVDAFRHRHNREGVRSEGPPVSGQLAPSALVGRRERPRSSFFYFAAAMYGLLSRLEPEVRDAVGAEMVRRISRFVDGDVVRTPAEVHLALART